VSGLGGDLLMIFQRLHPLGALSVAVRELQCGPVRELVRRRKGIAAQALSVNTSAYSPARSRLPLEVAEKVADVIFEWSLGEPQILPGLKGPMYLIDGSMLLSQHSEDLARAYPPPRNQHGASHWPAMRVLVAHEAVSGLAMRPCWGPLDGPKAVSEQGLTKEMMRRLPAGSVALSDRNLGVFPMAYHGRQNQLDYLFRTTEARARKLHRGVLPNAGTDQQILWGVQPRGPPQQPRTSGTGRGGMPLGSSHMLTAQSKDMVEKELALGVAAYNLTRAAINEAAQALQLSPRQFSFSMARDTVNAFLPAFAAATSEEERQEIGKRMLRVMKQSLLPRRRKRRTAAREVWPRPCPFPKRKIGKKRPPRKE
jgi:hypothetical protein